MTPEHAGDFEAQRPHLTRLAYRMLGSVSEAEDAVQDSYLRWHRSNRKAVGNPRAYLSRVTTRLCLDRLRQVRRQREVYVGQWLPEPLVEDPAAAPPERTDRDVSMALMLALERLSPLERAAFILHDVFEMGFGEVAVTIGRSEAACRQLASRARAHVVAARPRFPVDPEEAPAIAEAFFAAARSGDVAGLRRVLAEGATLHGDGGGRRRTAINVIVGAVRIARCLAGLARKGINGDPIWSRSVTINGQPGRLSLERDGTLQTMAVTIEDGLVQAVFVTRNPEKLRHLEAMLPEDVARQMAR